LGSSPLCKVQARGKIVAADPNLSRSSSQADQSQPCREGGNKMID
jgi:hypothetical protein